MKKVVCLLLVLVVVSFAASTAHAGFPIPPCGEVTAPQCNGECPAGTRCTDLTEQLLTLARFAESMDPASASPQGLLEDCGCLEVRCGGELLEDGQGCCNGQAYEIGAEYCCNGAISMSPMCDCGEGTVDLASGGVCCGVDGEAEFTEDNVACCTNGSTAFSTYSYNVPFDCCAGETCGGRCEQGQCVGSDCCNCIAFDSEEPPPVCATADSDIGCLAACFLSGPTVGFFCPPEFVDPQDELCSEASVRTEGGVCTENGCATPTATATATATSTRVPVGGSCADSLQCEDGLFCVEGFCTAVAAPAPAASSGALVATIAALVAIAALAIVRRKKHGGAFSFF